MPCNLPLDSPLGGRVYTLSGAAREIMTVSQRHVEQGKSERISTPIGLLLPSGMARSPGHPSNHVAPLFRTRQVEVDYYVIENGKARLCPWTGCGRMWTLHAFGAWPAGAHPDRNDVGAGWTICGGDWPDDRRLAPDGGRVRHPFLAVWRADSASLAADRDLLGSSRLRTFSFSHSLGLGVLLYWSVSCLIAALLSHGDCEIVAFPSLLFRRHYTVYCPLNAVDLVERHYTKR